MTDVKKEDKPWPAESKSVEYKPVESKPVLKVEDKPKEEVSWEKGEAIKACEVEISELKDKMAKITDEWGQFSSIPQNSPYWDYKNQLTRHEEHLKLLKG